MHRGKHCVRQLADISPWSRDSLPNLPTLSNSNLCVQASSTPPERVFSSTGHAISQERCRILPEKANMVIFRLKFEAGLVSIPTTFILLLLVNSVMLFIVNYCSCVLGDLGLLIISAVKRLIALMS